MAKPQGVKRVTYPFPTPTPPNLQLVGQQPEDSDTHVAFDDGSMKIEHPDGSVTIDFNPPNDGGEKDEFSSNLAFHMGDGDLESIANDLLEGIQADLDSRREWVETRAQGIGLLGLKIEKPRTDSGASQAPMEGMATVKHPLLLKATVEFQATARGELLPTGGPVKIRNDATTPPQWLMETSAITDLRDSLESLDEDGQALEKDMNHYLTAVATEYIPDTDRMLFYIGFGGDGFKKVYNCPIRRRPTSESVDAEDLIVSDATTDLQSCPRITHRIKMRRSVLKRMQILKVYRDVDLDEIRSVPPIQDAVDKKKEDISGVRQITQRPKDQPFEVYESYVELDLDEFAPKKFKGKGVPLPYRVTIEKESRKILDIRRNWDEDDEECLAKQFFVQFPFVRGLGFYGLGYIHLLGNSAMTLTGAWRMILDGGMFANFPGFLFAKGVGRQNSNQIRIPPGSGFGIDVGAQQRIQDAIMPLPYRETGPSFVNFITHVEQVGEALASATHPNVGEGKQDAPVGTTLALIEQASKVLDSVHKRLHAAQAEEFKLLKERFREDPESFWRHNKRPAKKWEKEQFLEALNRYELVPVADPNNPTSLHRIAKAMAIKTLQQGAPDLYDPVAVDMRIMRIVGIDPQGLFRPTPAQPPPDPRMVAIQQKAQAEASKNQIAQTEAQIKAMQVQNQLMDKAKDRESREKIEALKLQQQMLKLKQEEVIHQYDHERDMVQLAHQQKLNETELQHNLVAEAAAKAQEIQHTEIAHQHEMHGGRVQAEHEAMVEHHRQQAEIERERMQHEAAMERDRQQHAMKMEHTQQMHEAKLEQAKALARVAAKAKPKGEKK